MKRLHIAGSLAYLALFIPIRHGNCGTVPQFLYLLNGNRLANWVNVNTSPETWRIKNDVLVYSGHPIGVMRS